MQKFSDITHMIHKYSFYQVSVIKTKNNCCKCHTVFVSLHYPSKTMHCNL